MNTFALTMAAITAGVSALSGIGTPSATRIQIAASQGLHRPATHRVDAFAEALGRGGLKVTVRRQRGADRSAACGQLRLRHAESAGS